VILVDFRGIDTMGEITVLGIAAIGVYALLKLHTGRDEEGDVQMTSLILKTTTRYLTPLLLIFSVFLFLRGHNQPGGGFAGGLGGGGSFCALFHCVRGGGGAPRAAGKAAPVDRRGLLASFTSGVISLLNGLPFLTGLWGYVQVPGLGKLEVGTPVLFDLGVYLVVMGVTLSMIFALEEAG
jgi:multisubunit Na+/H+ antiporter MnhB subunit